MGGSGKTPALAQGSAAGTAASGRRAPVFRTSNETPSESSPGEPAPPKVAPSAEACAHCKAEKCKKGKYEAQCSATSGTSAGGRGIGSARSKLCTAVVDCVRRAGCAAKGFDLQPCYCGEGVGDEECLSGAAKGPCKQAIEDASETAEPVMLANRFAEPDFAIAQAINQFRCENHICVNECQSN
jgi:hypothetical protein